MAWEQLEIPIPGVMQPLPGVSGCDLAHPLLGEYGQSAERGAMMLKITISDGDDDPYEIEAHHQGLVSGSLANYKIVIDGEEVGVVRHDLNDGLYGLARRVLNVTPNPDRTLKEEGGAHTAVPFRERVRSAVAGEQELPPTEGAKRILQVHLARNREDLRLREARASAELAGEQPELPSTRLNREAVERVQERMRQEGWPSSDDDVDRLLTRLAAQSPRFTSLDGETHTVDPQ